MARTMATLMLSVDWLYSHNNQGGADTSGDSQVNGTTPVSSAIKLWTDQDTVLSKVMMSGWPAEGTESRVEFQPYRQRRYELSIEDGCI